MVNAISGAGEVGFRISDTNQSSAKFGYASAEVSLIDGEKPLSFYSVNADGIEQDIYTEFSYHLNNYQDVLLFLYGTPENIQHLFVEVDYVDSDSADIPLAGFLNLSAQPALDLYLTDDTTGIHEVEPTLSAQSQSFSGMAALELDTYEIQIVEGGTKNILYDAGFTAIGEIENHFYIAFDSGSGLRVLQISADDESLQLIDEEAATQLSFINAIADSSPVDVYFGDMSTPPIFENVAFGATVSYLPQDAGLESINITPHGSTTPFIYESDIVLSPGEYQSLVVAGLAGDSIQHTLLLDNSEKIADRARLRFVHASASNEAINVYFRVPGQPVGDASPIVSALDFLHSYAFELSSGNYEVTIIQSDNEATVISTYPITLANNEIVDMFLTDSNGGGTPGKLTHSTR